MQFSIVAASLALLSSVSAQHFWGANIYDTELCEGLPVKFFEGFKNQSCTVYTESTKLYSAKSDGNCIISYYNDEDCVKESGYCQPDIDTACCSGEPGFKAFTVTCK